MSIKIVLILILSFFPNAYVTQTVCDNYLTYTSRMMQNFTANAYNPMRVSNIFSYMNVL